jgi:hypothetical protein
MKTVKEQTAKQLTCINRMVNIRPGALIFVELAGTPGNINMHIGDETFCWMLELFNALLVDMLRAKAELSHNAAYLQAADAMVRVLNEEASNS